MDFDFVERLKEVLASQEGDLTALRGALLLTIRLVGDRRAYKEAKTRPHTSLRKFVHWLLTGFRPLKAGLDRHQHCILKDADGQPWVVRRVVNRSDGKYRVVIPLDGNAATLARTERKFEYDLCISFAGEDRAVAAGIAASTRDKWGGAKIFLDEFEKWKLWGNDLTSALYDVYSNQSRRCLIVVSSSYLLKAWPKHELRAAYARMVKEGVGYILPFIVDDSQPPQELEMISYLRLADTSVEELGQQLADRVFEEGYSDWLMVDDLAEVLLAEFRFNTMISQFRHAMENESSTEEALAKAILSLIWTSENVILAVENFFEYLLFDFDPLAKRFDESGQYLAVPPDGMMRRSVSEDGPLLMHASFWDPIFEEAKAGNPLFSDKADARRRKCGP